MKTKILFVAGMALAASSAFAQETYENANLVENELNGTARYVGMGGSMDALGADISTIGTNPAGIGLFRKSQIAGSFGLVSQEEVESFSPGNKTNMSFDQIGFVYSTRTGRKSFLNFGFNYHKSRNFDQILSASSRLTNASQNKLTYQKLREGLLYELDDNGLPREDRAMITHNQLDNIYYKSLIKDADGNFGYYDASGYTFNKAMRGYIGEYDLNISGNLNDHYDPRTNVIRLSDNVYGSTSTAAIGVACHEAGHAVQYAQGYAPIKLRAAVIPLTNFGSKLAMPLILIGLLFSSLGRLSNFFIYLGIACFGLSLVFQLVTLPVEFNASRRALDAIAQTGILSEDEQVGARKTLTAAALTYVAATAAALAQLLRLLVLFGNRNRRNN